MGGSEARHVGSGKVRELFEVGDDRLLLVASDRISAYDVILPQDIPDKGKVLTGLSHYWLEVMETVCPNHLVSVAAEELPDVGIEDLPGRAMLCRKAEPIAIEFVVRGYLSGSGWKEYRRDGSVCGHELPEGLAESDRLPGPLLTPATKAVTGHDENITEQEAAGIAGAEVYERARSYALEIYRKAAAIALERGVIIADTKFEFGLIDGEMVLVDELLTPDSSRYWPAEGYAPGLPQPSFDKQFVRDYAASTGWDKTPPAPPLPADVVARTRQRYVEAYERLTGQTFAAWLQRR